MNGWEYFVFTIISLLSFVTANWCVMLSKRVMRLERMIYKGIFDEEE